MPAEIASTARALEDSLTSRRQAPESIPGGSVHKEGLRRIWVPMTGPSPTVDRSGLAANDSARSTQIGGQGNGVAANGAVQILPPPVSSVPTASLHALQEWEGYVTDIREGEFWARLRDLTAGDVVEQEEAAIPLEEIDAEDRSRISVGSIFRWVIGYERSVGGMRKRVSQIVFLDLPRMTEQDLDRGREWADRMLAKWNRE